MILHLSFFFLLFFFEVFFACVQFVDPSFDATKMEWLATLKTIP
jgi:uncharacterized protein involved in cysteine biosynthesis